MKQFKLIGTCILILFSMVSLVNAISTNNVEAYWKLDNLLNDSTGNGHTLTNSGSNFTINGKINEALLFNAAADKSTTSIFAGTASINAWVYLNSNSTTKAIVADRNVAGYYLTIDNNLLGEIHVLDDIGGTSQHCYSEGMSWNTGEWYMVTFVINGTSSMFYRNGINIPIGVKGCAITDTSTLTTGDAGQGLTVGNFANTNVDFDGRIDEVGIWTNYKLTPTNISDLYNNDTGLQYPFVIAPIVPGINFINVTINDRENWNNTLFNTYNLTLDVELLNVSTNDNINVTYTVNNYTPENNQFITNNLTGSVNFNRSASYPFNQYVKFINTNVNGDPEINGTKIGFGGIYSSLSDTALAFCNMTLSSERVFSSQSQTLNTDAYFWNGTNFVLELNVTILDFLRATECEIFGNDATYELDLFAINNETNTNYTGNHFHIDTTPPIITFNNNTEWNDGYTINLSLFNITCSDANLDTCIVYWDDGTNTTNTTGNITGTKTFTNNSNHTFIVEAIDQVGIHINSTGTFLLNPYQYFNFKLENGTAITNYTFGGKQFNDTANFTVYNDILNLGSNNLTFEKFGFKTQTFNILINLTSELNETFNISEATIFVTIRDKSDSTIVTGTNFSLEFIATVGLLDYTITGTYNVSNLFFKDEQYQLVVSGDGYTTESNFFNFNNKEDIYLDVFVDNSSTSGFVIVKVVDKFGKGIPGEITRALQWDSVTSQYLQVVEGLTDDGGNSILQIILDDKQYIFTTTVGGITVNSTQQFIPTALNGKEIVLSIEPGATEEDYVFKETRWNIIETYNETSRISNITFSWTSDSSVEGCIIYYRITNGERLLLDENCFTSESAIITSEVIINSSYDVIASIGFKESGIFTEVDYFNYYSIIHPSQIFKSLNIHYYIMPLLNLLAVLISLSNIFVGALAAILFNGGAIYIVPDFTSKAVIAFQMVIALIIIGVARKKK